MLKEENGTFVTDDKAKADILQSQFLSVFSDANFSSVVKLDETPVSTVFPWDKSLKIEESVVIDSV